MNYVIKEFETKLVEFINASNIPIEAKRLVVKEVLGLIEN